MIMMSKTISKPLNLSQFLLQAMSAYGFEIVQTLIVDIEPDVHVKRAMNEINAGNQTDLIFSLCAF